ncbi:unnamed protein product [Camellia sinensis]
MKLKQHWSNPPSINHWTPSSSSSNSTHCDWSEVTRTNGSISGLALKNISIIAGTVPPFICNPKNLITLDRQYNYFSGQFPKSLYNCSKLEYLLRHLNLGANNFTGDIPGAIGRLLELRSLLLFQCEFHSGLIPTKIGNLSMLEVRDISYNDFTPLVMPSSFTWLKKLKQLWMRRSRLIGEIPKSMGNLTALEILDLASNDLSGSIPSGLFLLENLTTLYLYKNHLSWAIPKSVEASKMEVIDVSQNNLTGTIPDDFGRLTKLWSLTLSFNRLSGRIPARLWDNLEYLNISNNLFMGHLPDGLYSNNLSQIDISNNKFSGEIRVGGSLTTLNLSQNKLSGPIPADIGFLPVLTDLDLSENEFSGQILPEIGLLRLTSLNLSSNRLTGRIPVEFEMAIFYASFLNNSGLCASNPLFELNVCSSGVPNWIKLSANPFAIVANNFNVEQNLTAFQMLDFTELDIVSSLTESNVIGKGGSGKVYHVAVNRSGIFVAVKRIWNSKKLDQRLEKEFLAEVQILGMIRHSNIVKLLCCITSENSKLLVYEYLENHSLDRWLHRKKRPSIFESVHHVVLDWPKQLQIAVGAARGLCYMHHDCAPSLIHRDVKSSNILLDSQCNANIADFGLAKILVNHGEPNTMSIVAGTFGYIASEHARTTRVNEKIDVYSFGVVLLELVTGKEANDGDEDMCLAEWEVKKACYLDEMAGVFKLGIICTGTLPSTRPSMKEVLQILLGCSQQLPLREDNVRSNYGGVAPLHTNSRHERIVEDNDDGLALDV